MAAEAETTTELAPERVAELVEEGDAQVIDVRADYEHAAGHIPGTRHIPLIALQDGSSGLDRGRQLVLYCRSGERSGAAAQAFRASGWDAHNMAGGLLAWAERGLPLEPEDGEVAERSNLPGA
jgi:rhodanese-related sulfurtransferase